MEAVTRLMQSWWGNAFIRNNAIFWTASLGVSFLNYLYYPILGRIMQPADFGETQTVISIFTQLGVFFQVLSLVSIGIIIKYTDKAQRERLTDELSRLTLLFSLVMLIATVVFSPFLKEFFNFASLSPFVVLAISLIVSVPLAFANSYLQGHNRFWTLSVSNLLVACSKIVFSVGFVLLGFKTAGAMGGIVCAQLLALIYALQKGSGVRHFIGQNLHFHLPRPGVLKPEMSYILIVLVTSIPVNLLLSLNILAVKHYFPPEQAGLLSGISIIANIIYFITAPLAAVLIPSVIPAQSLASNHHVLKRSLLLTVLIGGAVLALFAAVPNIVITVLLGSKYAVFASFLPGLSITVFVLSLANLLIYYHIGMRHFLVAPAVIGSLILTLSLLAQAQASMTMIIQALAVGGGILVVVLLGLLAFYKNEPVKT